MPDDTDTHAARHIEIRNAILQADKPRVLELLNSHLVLDHGRTGTDVDQIDKHAELHEEAEELQGTPAARLGEANRLGDQLDSALDRLAEGDPEAAHRFVVGALANLIERLGDPRE